MENSQIKQRDNKKGLILKESFKLFLARGYDGVSFTDIERAANVTRGAIFHFFENKKDLFKNVVEMFVFTFLADSNYGEEYLSSPTPLKVFMGKCLDAIETRMERFLQGNNSDVTAASFMSFILYLKDHYDAWNENVRAYEEQKLRVWTNVINLAKERKEIAPDTNAQLLAGTLHNLYLGLSYRGAAVDKLSIPDLKMFWEYIYQQNIK